MPDIPSNEASSTHMIWMQFLFSAVCVVVPFAIAQRLGSIPLVSPLHILSYFAFFGIFLKTVYMNVMNGRMFFEDYNLPAHALTDGFLFLILFIASICAGYVLSTQRLWRARPDIGWREAVSSIRYPRLMVAASFAAAAFVTLEMLTARGFSGLGSVFTSEALDALNSRKVLRIEGVEGFGDSNAALKQILFIPSLTLALFVARYTLWRRREDMLWLVVLGLLEFYLAVVQGKRFALVGTFAVFIIIPGILGVRFSTAAISKVIGGIFAVLLVFTVMTSLRVSDSTQRETVFDPTPAIEHILGSTYFMDINILILIMSLSREEERFNGSSYLNFTYAWIPRAFWPEKPVVTLGPYVKQEVLGIYGTIGGINPTGPGEAFLNFGWAGVLVGFFLGWLYRRIETLLISSTQFARRYGIWIYSTVAFSFISASIQSSFAAALTSALVNSVAIILFLVLVRRLVLSQATRPT